MTWCFIDNSQRSGHQKKERVRRACHSTGIRVLWAEDDFARTGGEREFGAAFAVEFESSWEVEVANGNFARPGASGVVVRPQEDIAADDGVFRGLFLVPVTENEDSRWQRLPGRRLVEGGENGGTRRGWSRRHDFDWSCRGQADPAIATKFHYNGVGGTRSFCRWGRLRRRASGLRRLFWRVGIVIVVGIIEVGSEAGVGIDAVPARHVRIASVETGAARGLWKGNVLKAGGDTRERTSAGGRREESAATALCVGDGREQNQAE